jgi:choline dehydrogenase-like flavoprotein
VDYDTPALWSTVSIEPDLDHPYDAVVVGSGFGGGTAAYELTRLGARTLLVEKGEFLERAPDSSGRVGVYIDDIRRPGSDQPSYVGGATKFYGAAMYRLRESDFGSVEHEAGMSRPWPISYAELEPFYDQAESLYGVHGSVGDDPTEPPHQREYGWGDVGHVAQIRQLVDDLRAAGFPVSPIPKAVDYGPEGRCVLCPTCDGYYCTRDAKGDSEIAAIRPAMQTGLLSTATGTECLKVLTDPAESATTGVLVRRAGIEHRVSAKSVVVAAGVPYTAALLRRSRTARHPDGLGNAGGALGRYMSSQVMGPLFPLLGPSAARPAHIKTFALTSFYHGSKTWPYPMGTLQATGQMPFWRGQPWYRWPVARALGQTSFMCIYVTEGLGTSETGLRFEGDKIVGEVPPVYNISSFRELRSECVKAFRTAGYRTFAPRMKPIPKSESGGACIGNDPRVSVADPNGEVRGVSGLYVADASVLPSVGAVNTGLTIAALSLRTAAAIARTS